MRWAGIAERGWAAVTTNASKPLNQLLVEMDGFEGNEGIIVIASTNRPDVSGSSIVAAGPV